MKKTYFEPEMRIVKLHGRPLLEIVSGQQTISSSKTNLGTADDFYYEGAGAYEGR